MSLRFSRRTRVFSNWAYNPAINATFVTEQRFPAVPGMVRTVRTAEREGARTSI
jgi:hypothetical protein